jgi:hypothetical protein
MDNIEDIGRTLDFLSISYNDSLYEKDLFRIFRIATIYEKSIIYNEARSIDTNVLRIKFIKELIEFKEKCESYGEICGECDKNIKNKIMIISIFRKIHTIIKGKLCCFIGINDVKDIKDISHIFDIILKMNKI